jgi:hypothetical protein
VLARSFLLDPQLADKAYWSFLHHRVHSGHFALLDALLQLPCVAQPTSTAADTLREEFLSAASRSSLVAYADYFGSSSAMRKNLAVFFAQHLPQGF